MHDNHRCIKNAKIDRSSILYDLPTFLRSRTHREVAGIRNKLNFSITVITTWIHLVGRKRPEGGREEVSPLEEIEKGWRERQEAGVINC